MGAYKKALALTKISTKHISTDDIEALAVNLKVGKPYGMEIHYKYGTWDFYEIKRDGQEVCECTDIIELIDKTWAIVSFLEAPNRSKDTN